MSVVLNSVECCYRLQCDNCNSVTASYTTSGVVVLHLTTPLPHKHFTIEIDKKQLLKTTQYKNSFETEAILRMCYYYYYYYTYIILHFWGRNYIVRGLCLI